MQRTLVFLRHAKSDWADFTLSDFERPLNLKGIKDIRKVAKWLNDKLDRTPDLILSSSAKRTKETVDGLIPAFKVNESKIKYLDELYLAGLKSILNVMKNTSPTVQTLFIIGHNQGISEAAAFLSKQSVRFFKTSCGVILNFNTDNWDLYPYSGEVMSEIVCSEID